MSSKNSCLWRCQATMGQQKRRRLLSLSGYVMMVLPRAFLVWERNSRVGIFCCWKRRGWMGLESRM